MTDRLWLYEITFSCMTLAFCKIFFHISPFPEMETQPKTVNSKFFFMLEKELTPYQKRLRTANQLVCGILKNMDALKEVFPEAAGVLLLKRPVPHNNSEGNGETQIIEHYTNGLEFLKGQDCVKQLKKQIPDMSLKVTIAPQRMILDNELKLRELLVLCLPNGDWNLDSVDAFIGFEEQNSVNPTSLKIRNRIFTDKTMTDIGNRVRRFMFYLEFGSLTIPRKKETYQEFYDNFTTCYQFWTLENPSVEGAWKAVRWLRTIPKSLPFFFKNLSETSNKTKYFDPTVFAPKVAENWIKDKVRVFHGLVQANSSKKNFQKYKDEVMDDVAGQRLLTFAMDLFKENLKKLWNIKFAPLNFDTFTGNGCSYTRS